MCLTIVVEDLSAFRREQPVLRANNKLYPEEQPTEFSRARVESSPLAYVCTHKIFQAQTAARVSDSCKCIAHYGSHSHSKYLAQRAFDKEYGRV